VLIEGYTLTYPSMAQYAGVFSERPQYEHASALVDTWSLHSGQLM